VSHVNVALLRTFLTAYRTRSMTRTAAELGLSQPGITAQMHGLEKQLDSVLFRRTTRGLLPTAAGDELAERIAPHLDALAAALNEAVELRGAARDPFRRVVLLGGPPELTAMRILPSLADLYGHGLRLRVTTGLADELLHDLTNGALDLVVSTIRPRGRSVVAVPLADEEFVLVAAPDRARQLDLSAMAAHPRGVLGLIPVVAYGKEFPIVRRYWRHVFGQAPPLVAGVLVGDLRAVAAACVAGAGYSALPRYLIRDELADGRLMVLHHPEDPPINTFYLAWRSSAVHHPAVSAVRTQLRMNAPLW
jgi:DNA-binding transcriptional LysR family regulator